MDCKMFSHQTWERGKKGGKKGGEEGGAGVEILGGRKESRVSLSPNLTEIVRSLSVLCGGQQPANKATRGGPLRFAGD